MKKLIYTLLIFASMDSEAAFIGMYGTGTPNYTYVQPSNITEGLGLQFNSAGLLQSFFTTAPSPGLHTISSGALDGNPTQQVSSLSPGSTIDIVYGLNSSGSVTNLLFGATSGNFVFNVGSDTSSVLGLQFNSSGALQTFFSSSLSAGTHSFGNSRLDGSLLPSLLTSYTNFIYGFDSSGNILNIQHGHFWTSNTTSELLMQFDNSGHLVYQNTITTLGTHSSAYGTLDGAPLSVLNNQIGGNGTFNFIQESRNTVPEPATISLMGLGFAGLAYRRRKPA